jgi:hypothetical protein
MSPSRPVSTRTVEMVELAVSAYVAGRASADSTTPEAFWQACEADVLALLRERLRVQRLDEVVARVVATVRCTS